MAAESPKAGQFFDSFANVFDTFYDGKRSPVMRWVNQRFRSDMFLRYSKTFDFVGNLHGKRVLDVGCGSGPYLAEALRRGASHVTGLDAAPAMLALTRERVVKLGALDRVNLIEGYFPEACPKASYDFAIVMGVMDYVEDAPAFIRQLAAITTTGAALSFPSQHWLRTPVRKLRYKLRKCPVWFYTPAGIADLMRTAGVNRFQVDKIPGAGMDFFVTIAP